ncbi:hypothetical protein I4U23_000150 [Adineta vaga]|nr:hypothetical protein I4U23_000150 [Adineta vaga]
MFDIREEISLTHWLNDCKVAVVPIINSEVFINGHGGPCIQPHLSNLIPDIANSGWRDYGNRQGTNRLLTIFSDLQIPVSIAMNSYLIDKETDLFQEIKIYSKENQNIDIIGHGLTNSLSAVKHISFEEQVKQSLDQIEQALGHQQRPKAWLTPGFSAPDNSTKILGKDQFIMNSNVYRKWIGIIWLLIEVNLISANIFGFAALFKILPKYGIYSKYCHSLNGINSTEQDCTGQAQQYQNALTLGIIFFNLPSMFVGILIDMFGGRFVKLIAIYATCNYFSQGRAFLLTLLVGSSLSASIWYSVFQVLIDNNKLTLSQLSYIWMSFGILMFLSSFLFLDWKFPILNLEYKLDTKLERMETISTNGTKWYTNIYQRVGFWKYITNPLYILVVLYLSILLMPNILLSVTWYPWIYYINHNDKIISDKYTFAFNMASLSQIILCPIVGFLLAFRSEQNQKQKLLNAAIIQTLAWILNIIICIICMFVKSSVIIPALIFNYIGRSVIVAGSQAVISTFFPSEYIGRLTGIMWTSAGVITCIQYGLVNLTIDVPQSWRAWIIVLILILCMSCHLIQIWYITFKKFSKRIPNIPSIQSDISTPIDD